MSKKCNFILLLFFVCNISLAENMLLSSADSQTLDSAVEEQAQNIAQKIAVHIRKKYVAQIPAQQLKGAVSINFALDSKGYVRWLSLIPPEVMTRHGENEQLLPIVKKIIEETAPFDYSDYFNTHFWRYRVEFLPESKTVFDIHVYPSSPFPKSLSITQVKEVIRTPRIRPESVANKCVIESTQSDHHEPEMVVIPAGSFMMGSNEIKNEKPEYLVTLNSFELSKYEITQGQWLSVMGKNPSYFKDCGCNCPVENVSWHDTQAFIKKLNQKTGKRYRLPSESEWEYACYGGEKSAYCGGNDKDSLAWYLANSDYQTHPVGQKQPNGYSLYDMSGNVLEWVQDTYYPNYKGAPTDGSARENSSYQSHILRGGSWSYSSLRATSRDGYFNNASTYEWGFRVARTLP